jgi:hypothetical protein
MDWIAPPFIDSAIFVYGLCITGRYGLSVVLAENEALTLHKLLHLPLIFFFSGSLNPGGYISMMRWGWIKP